MSRAAVVLAAGAARRFGSDKLSALFRGEPLLAHAIRAARAAPVSRVIVVAPPGLDIGVWPGEPDVETVRIISAALSESLKAGLSAAHGADSVFVFLGDMPLVPHDLAGRLAAILDGRYAAIPRHAGCSGHPVLLSARAFPDIAGLSGDAGAGKLLAANGDIAFLDGAGAGSLADIDRAEDLSRLEQRPDL